MFESIYWEQYKKAMALSGVVLPVHPPPPAQSAINMALDVVAQPVTIKQEPIPIVEQEYKVQGSPKPIPSCPAEEPEAVVDASPAPIKDEAMEVDERKEEAPVVASDDHTRIEPVDILPGNSSEGLARAEEGSTSSEQLQKNNLVENEQNAESRCSTGSNDDMWRPW